MILKFLTNSVERKIFLLSGLILVVLVLVTGISVFRIIQPHTEELVTSSLETSLDNKVKLIETHIKHAIADTQEASLFIPHDEDQNKENQIDQLQALFNKILQNHFSGLRFYDLDENLVMSAGINSKLISSAMVLNTGSSIDTTLFWDERFVLRNSIRILNKKNQLIGRLVTEETLTDLMRILDEVILSDNSQNFILCNPVVDQIQEMDCFQRDAVGYQFKRLPRFVSNQETPMHWALDGRTGVKWIKDQSNVHWAVAHAPVAFGLGATLYINEEEFNQKLIEQSYAITLWLAFLVLLGMSALYRLTFPLIQESIDSKEALLETQAILEQAKQSAEKISTELMAYINAIGHFAAILVTDNEGKIIQANEKFYEISGHSHDEIIEKDCRTLNSDCHPQEFWSNLWETVTANRIWHQEICSRNKFGTLYWVDTTIVPLTDPNGKISNYLIVCVDITTRKQNDFELRERLKESSCMHEIHDYIKQNPSMERILQNVAEAITRAFQLPDKTGTMIALFGRKFSTPGFDSEAPVKLSANIVVNDEVCGRIHVANTRGMPFLLPYEQRLLDDVARELGHWYERMEADQRIMQMATHDGLTGLPNRHLLQDRITQALAHESRDQKQLAVLFIDLDHFKNINDNLGHDTGDLLLQEVAKRLTNCVRGEDTVARQGGDEFIVVLNMLSKPLDAATVARKVLNSLQQPFHIGNNELHIGSSIGIAVFPDDGMDAETLLKNSDIAMYHAKDSGRNNYQFFTDELNKSANERHRLGIDLRHALEREELFLHYQPVMKMPDCELYSIEALLRWRHPKHDLIPPVKFIGLAEETGMIIPIGEWVIETVCKQIKAWQNQGYQVPTVAINLSVQQFRDKGLVSNISRILAATEVDAKYIALEITESMLVDDVKRVVETLNCLNAMGINIAIDDFGTGYSSLSYLKRFPINTLKIDRSFVRDIVTDKSDSAIVAAIIALAKNLGLNVIAEGVETEEQLNILMQQECRYFQGYYFSKPVASSEIERQLIKLPQPSNLFATSPRLKQVNNPCCSAAVR